MKMTGDQIREIRKSKGLTQEFFANMFGVNRCTVVKWEKDGLDDGTASRLLKVYCTPGWGGEIERRLLDIYDEEKEEDRWIRLKEDLEWKRKASFWEEKHGRLERIMFAMYDLMYRNFHGQDTTKFPGNLMRRVINEDFEFKKEDQSATCRDVGQIYEDKT